MLHFNFRRRKRQPLEEAAFAERERAKRDKPSSDPFSVEVMPSLLVSPEWDRQGDRIARQQQPFRQEQQDQFQQEQQPFEQQQQQPDYYDDNYYQDDYVEGGGDYQDDYYQDGEQYVDDYEEEEYYDYDQEEPVPLVSQIPSPPAPPPPSPQAAVPQPPPLPQVRRQPKQQQENPPPSSITFPSNAQAPPDSYGALPPPPDYSAPARPPLSMYGPVPPPPPIQADNFLADVAAFAAAAEERLCLAPTAEMKRRRRSDGGPFALDRRLCLPSSMGQGNVGVGQELRGKVEEAECVMAGLGESAEESAQRGERLESENLLCLTVEAAGEVEDFNEGDEDDRGVEATEKRHCFSRLDKLDADDLKEHDCLQEGTSSGERVSMLFCYSGEEKDVGSLSPADLLRNLEEVACFPLEDEDTSGEETGGRGRSGGDQVKKSTKRDKSGGKCLP